MMTDPARKRRNDPGNPEVCPVFDFHKITALRRPLHSLIANVGPPVLAVSIVRR